MRERRAAAANGETARQVPAREGREETGRRAEGLHTLMLCGQDLLRETTELTGMTTPCGDGGPDPAFRRDALAHREGIAPAEFMIGAHASSRSGKGARSWRKQSMLGVWTGRKWSAR